MITWTYTCTTCPARLPVVDDDGTTAAPVAQQVRDAGWRKIDGSLYCRECASQRTSDDDWRTLWKIEGDGRIMLQTSPEPAYVAVQWLEAKGYEAARANDACAVQCGGFGPSSLFVECVATPDSSQWGEGLTYAVRVLTDKGIGTQEGK